MTAIYVGGFADSRTQGVATFEGPPVLERWHEDCVKRLLQTVDRFGSVEPCDFRGFTTLFESLDVGEVQIDGESRRQRTFLCTQMFRFSEDDELRLLSQPVIVLRKRDQFFRPDLIFRVCSFCF